MGQKFDENKLPLGVVINKQFPNTLKAVAKCSQYGHNKYPEDIDWLNYQRVDNWEERYINAFARHWLSEGNDEESGLPHIYHALWNLMALVEKIELEEEIVIDLEDLSEKYPNDTEFGIQIRQIINRK